ncbi:MAG: aldehyde ferredoxin oxidoreductase N-terminal domain-containing protein, partial [Thermofilum sp.]
MKGWTGRILWIDLSSRKIQIQEYSGDFARRYVGGRGFAARILWDHVPAGTDPLSPQNLLVFAAGPLTGLPGPSTGKLVVATKSPLTHGYGDGNIGTRAAVGMRRAGFDAVVVKGRAEKPVYLYVEDGKAEVLSADDLWGLDAFSAERKLLEKHGKAAGALVIGPAGERLVAYATVISQEGRSGGRVGVGAVMGSKNLKAVVFNGREGVEVADEGALRRLAADSYREIKRRPQYGFWMRQGTMMTIQ